MNRNNVTVAEDDIKAFQENGVFCLRGAFKDWVAPLLEGVGFNEANPSQFAGNSVTGNEHGRFFDDYCNWQRIPQYRDFVLNSPAAEIAAKFCRSTMSRIFHEHLLIKEPGTSKITPWHHDLPYYNVQGTKTVSIWLALDPVEQATSPEFIAGSHSWGRMYYPRRFIDSSNYAYEEPGFETVPDIEAERKKYDIRSYQMQPGDAILFNFLTLHGAPPNFSQHRRRAFSTRWVGDDVTYIKRSGQTSPPYNDLGLMSGDRLPDQIFPVVWRDPKLSRVG